MISDHTKIAVAVGFGCNLNQAKLNLNVDKAQRLARQLTVPKGVKPLWYDDVFG